MIATRARLTPVDEALEDPAVTRAAALAALGHGPRSPAAEAELAAAVGEDPDPRARAAALGALARLDPVASAGVWPTAAVDPDASVRRRAAELAPGLGTDAPLDALRALLDDRDVTVVVAAAWALGELAAGPTVPDLAAVTTGHDDALAREAAVAALGAIGDPGGLPAILAACADKPTVRRRAVLALAPFEGDAVDAALRAALTDRDWQVRQAAEDLTGEPGEDAPGEDAPGEAD